ncbi:MAG TPA: hypothetical protein VK742_10150 [Candidatus Sulfotelmatobacter sp.]|jgi:hypothetical protein|nr:hypothetical protein [Candidatus Sulfotelmatobacter sp.]
MNRPALLCGTLISSLMLIGDPAHAASDDIRLRIPLKISTRP